VYDLYHINAIPRVIIDVAHNSSGILELKKTIQSIFPDRNIILIFGVLKEKNIMDMIQIIHTICQMIIITRPLNERAADPGLVKDIAANFFQNEQILMTNSISEAIAKGLKKAKNDDIILITGSFYLLPESIEYFDTIKNS
jgi:dihydrofolate synthase/folylpolyglutamate synthase